MLTNKKPGPRKGTLFWASLSIAALTACGPPGPRALVKGERLIRDGKYEQAIPQLQRATQLLPKNAQAWNHLGLAYHGNNQPLPAVRAYRQALSLDNKLAAARFNLGCVYLDQSELPSAIEHFTSYTYVQPNAPEGWVKLGTAQLRANKIDLAERNFRAALDLQTNNLEALNGLGLVQFQRKRYFDALNTFNSALASNPRYSPALLNAAIAAHQLPAQRQTALRFYRDYLALSPATEETEKIRLVANQLESELNPSRPVPPAVAAQRPPARANAVAAVTNQHRPTNVIIAVNNSSISLRTNQVPSVPAGGKPANPLTHAPSNAFVLTNLPTPPVSAGPAVEVTRVEDALVIKPPQDLSTTPAPNNQSSSAPVRPSTDATLILPLDKANRPEKKGLFSRVFSSKPKRTNSAPVAVQALPPAAPVVAAPALPVIVRRYAYLSPAKPASGNRVAAQKFLTEGLHFQKSGLLSQAINAYKRATATDPAFFDAYYNWAIAAYDSANWDEALRAYEYALAINPNSNDARYSFALALRQARYPQDSAEQFEYILQRSSNDTRVHLSLARLYAEQLKQPELAREHYRRVLDLDPSHPEAGAIRFWLASNKG